MPAQRFSTDLPLALARALSLGAFIGGSLSAQVSPLTGAARWADTVRVTIERATLGGSTSDLAAAGVLTDRALSAFPNDALLLHYRAYGLYRESQRDPDRGAESVAQIKRAIELLERSHALRPLAETQALLGTCLGMLANGGMAAGVRYGPASSSAREEAATLGPNNPRVLLLAAVSSWFTPKMWGGGEDKGYVLMQRAIAGFAGDNPARPLPAWGHAEAHAWLGQMELKRGNAAAARAAYRRALELEPGYQWVSSVLLPAVAGRL